MPRNRRLYEPIPLPLSINVKSSSITQHFGADCIEAIHATLRGGRKATMNDLAQQKTIDLARGLFLVRYNSADDKASPPMVRIFADRANSENCTIIAAPDASACTKSTMTIGLAHILSMTGLFGCCGSGPMKYGLTCG